MREISGTLSRSVRGRLVDSLDGEAYVLLSFVLESIVSLKTQKMDGALLCHATLGKGRGCAAAATMVRRTYSLCVTHFDGVVDAVATLLTCGGRLPVERLLVVG